MSLFGIKKKEVSVKSEKVATTKKPTTVAKSDKAVVAFSDKSVQGSNVTGISSNVSSILRPRITEKSGLLSQMGVYTFEISRNSNKNSVASAVKALYKVVPVKIAILNNPSRNVFIRGRKGVVSGFRKALVTLKKGDKIDFV